MTTVLWESDDNFSSMYTIWTGNFINMSTPKNRLIDERVFSNLDYAYVLSRRVVRIVHGSGIERNETTISPGDQTIGTIYLAANYITEFGMSWYTVLVTTPGGEMWYGPCPETSDSWIQTADGISPTPIDIVFPDMPQSPRFVVGVSGNPWAIVVYAPSGLAGRLNTDWSSMDSAATVTDLEATRII